MAQLSLQELGNPNSSKNPSSHIAYSKIIKRNSLTIYDAFPADKVDYNLFLKRDNCIQT